MAANNASQFLERLSDDSSFRAEFRTSAGGKVNAILDFTLSKGFSFTEPELKAALAIFASNPTIR